MGTQAVSSALDTTTSYEDLLVRSSVNDKGEIPFAGTPSSSPDIIPAGRNPVDPKSFLADMSKDYGQNILGGMDSNYIYVRGVNRAGKQQNGTVHLYWSQASLLQYPGQWEGNELPLDTGKHEGTPVQAAAAANFVAQAPFLWQKVPQPPRGDHYCLIGRLVTPDHANPIPTIMELSSFAAWITENRGMSWRNVTVVTDPHAPTWSQPLHYAQGTETKQVYVQLVCENFALGTEIGFSCGTPGPQPLISLPWVKVTAPSQISGIVTTIPAGFESTITYSYRSNGQKLPPNAKLKCEVVLVTQPRSPLERLATDLRSLVAPESMPSDHLEATGPKTGIRVGSYESAVLPTS